MSIFHTAFCKLIYEMVHIFKFIFPFRCLSITVHLFTTLPQLCSVLFLHFPVSTLIWTAALLREHYHRWLHVRSHHSTIAVMNENHSWIPYDIKPQGPNHEWTITGRLLTNLCQMTVVFVWREKNPPKFDYGRELIHGSSERASKTWAVINDLRHNHS